MKRIRLMVAKRKCGSGGVASPIYKEASLVENYTLKIIEITIVDDTVFIIATATNKD